MSQAVALVDETARAAHPGFMDELAEQTSTATMADRIRRFDWAATPIGSYRDWPQSLRTSVDIMLASGHAMCLLWGPEFTLLYNDGYAPFLGARHPAALGQSFADVWSEIWDDIGPLVERTYAGETVTFQEMPLEMTRNGFPEQTWWDFSYSPVRDEKGNVAGLLDVASDSTPRVIARKERDKAQAKLRESESFMRSVLSASTDCIKVLDRDGVLTFMSEGGMQVMEISDFNDVKGCPWPDFLKDDGPGFARTGLAEAREGRSYTFESAADTYLGTPKHWSVSVSPIFETDGSVNRILSVSRDVTALAEARAHQELLNSELGHRLKNVLTIVQSIASQSLRGAISVEDASSAFASRLASLGRATEVLTSKSWQDAEIGAVIESGLAAIAGSRDRVSIDGPPLRLIAQAALALTLALHELATNALKYGALSNETGTVSVEWRIVDRDGDERFDFKWRESGGPAVSPPSHRGFGSRLIERSLRAYFQGDALLSFPAEGVEFELDAPLAACCERMKA